MQAFCAISSWLYTAEWSDGAHRLLFVEKVDVLCSIRVMELGGTIEEGGKRKSSVTGMELEINIIKYMVEIAGGE